MVNDDPRRPERVARFQATPHIPTKKGQEDSSILTAARVDTPAPSSLNVMAVLSTVLGGAGMATRSKYLAWPALLACLSAAANVRKQHDGEMRAVVGAVMYVRADKRLHACGLDEGSDWEASSG